MNYSLIIPIYNEYKAIPTLCKKLNNLPDNIETVIIDDGSDDGSFKLLENFSEAIIIKNKKNYGKGLSIKKGINSCSSKHIIIIDGDLEIDIDDIPLLIKKYERNQKKVTVGVRKYPSNLKNYFNLNQIGSNLINLFFNVVYQSNVKDVLCCFRIMNRELFNSLDIQSKGFEIEVEMMSKLILNGIDMNQEKIKYNRRSFREGKKLKISNGWGIIYTILRNRF